jgi:hypothetical protein
MKVARRTDTPLHLWGDDLRLVDCNGNLVDADRASELQERVWGLFKDSFGYSTEHAGDIPTSASLYQYVRERIARLDVLDDDRELLVQFSQLWGNYTGSEIQRQSLKYVWTEVVCGGDEYFVETSLKSIVDAAAAVPLKKADVQLGTKVVGIVSEENHQHRRVTVQTQIGRMQTFDDVIVTIPLGCLKRGMHIFSPPLTPVITAAVESISVGHLEKVRYVVYLHIPSFASRLITSIGLYHVPKALLERCRGRPRSDPRSCHMAFATLCQRD